MAVVTLSAVIHREADVYVAECPELGTVSQGSTIEEAVSAHSGVTLNATDLSNLVAFLRQLDGAGTAPPVNNQPTLNALSNLAITQNAGLQTVNLSGITAGGKYTFLSRLSRLTSDATAWPVASEK